MRESFRDDPRCVRSGADERGSDLAEVSNAVAGEEVLNVQLQRVKPAGSPLVELRLVGETLDVHQKKLDTLGILRRWHRIFKDGPESADAANIVIRITAVLAQMRIRRKKMVIPDGSGWMMSESRETMTNVCISVDGNVVQMLLNWLCVVLMVHQALMQIYRIVR